MMIIKQVVLLVAFSGWALTMNAMKRNDTSLECKQKYTAHKQVKMSPELASIVVWTKKEIAQLKKRVTLHFSSPEDLLKVVEECNVIGGVELTAQLLKRCLTDKGCTLADISNYEGIAPLHYACIHKCTYDWTKKCFIVGKRIGSLDNIKTLLLAAKGQAINKVFSQDHHRETPLHYAVRSGDIEILPLFIKAAGKNLPSLIAIKNNNYQTALQIAQENGDDVIVSMLLNALESLE